MHKLALVVTALFACTAQTPATPTTPNPPPAAGDAHPVKPAGAVGGQTYGGAGYGGATYGGAHPGAHSGGGLSGKVVVAPVVAPATPAEAGDPCGGLVGGGGTGYGTIGHGSGTGTSNPCGGGGMRGRHDSTPSVLIGVPQATGDLDRAIIRRYIKRNLPKIQYCYEKQLLNGTPKLAGTLTLKFIIGTDGHVTESVGSGLHANVDSCVAAVVKEIEFPKPKGGGVVNVNYPFVFKPSGG